MKGVIVWVALACGSAHTQPPHPPRRGWLTGAGLAISAPGAGAVVIGAYNLIQGRSAAERIDVYYAGGTAPTAREASTLRWLQQRADHFSSLGLGLPICGAAAFVLGLSLILLDSWSRTPLLTGTF